MNGARFAEGTGAGIAPGSGGRGQDSGRKPGICMGDGMDGGNKPGKMGGADMDGVPKGVL